MPDPFGAGGISVTIKGDEPGGKFNDPKSPATWLVFHGSPTLVKDQIIEVFDLDASTKDRPLYDVVNEATKLFKAVNSVGTQLGGTVLNSGNKPATSAPLPVGSSFGGGDRANDDVWAKAASGNTPAPAGPPWEEEKTEDKDPVLTALANCQTVKDVMQVWAENQTAFNSNPAYMEAYKSRGKELSK